MRLVINKRGRRTRAAVVSIVALTLVLIATFLPGALGRTFAPFAAAQEPTPEPTPTETVEPSPEPPPLPEPTATTKPPTASPDIVEPVVKGPGGTGGDPSGDNEEGGQVDGTTSPSDPVEGGHVGEMPTEDGDAGHEGPILHFAPGTGFTRIGGSYTTDALVSVAARLRALGHPAGEELFSPFIIGGEASWVDTWGAPRYGPGPIVRTHEGQDVFCNFGDPVLATEPGTVEYADGGLGGMVARLNREDGSYWYYAHLSAFNSAEHPSGTRVQTGDVIGFCGNSGNALTTPPHVHFGWYQGNGASQNPMLHLVEWLRQAERNADAELAKLANERVDNIDPLTLAYRFGDALAPDTSAIGVAGESLFAYGSTPSAGSLSVAESALHTALSPDAPEPASEVGSPENLTGPAQSELDSGSELAKLIFGDAASHESTFSHETTFSHESAD